MALKKIGFFILVLAVVSFLCYPIQAQNPEASKSKHGAMTHSPGGEKKATLPAMPGPGEKVALPDGFYFIYGFDKKPKLGTLIIKVDIFTREGKLDTSFEVKADAGMPSMKGTHETGERTFTLSNKGDYLLPISIVMPGDWEVRVVMKLNGQAVHHGSIRFDV